MTNVLLSSAFKSCATRLGSALTGLRWSFRNAVVSFGDVAKASRARVALPSSELLRSAQRASSVAAAGCARTDPVNAATTIAPMTHGVLGESMAILPWNIRCLYRYRCADGFPVHFPCARRERE